MTKAGQSVSGGAGDAPGIADGRGPQLDEAAIFTISYSTPDQRYFYSGGGYCSGRRAGQAGAHNATIPSVISTITVTLRDACRRAML